ncbi:hypothetical protein ACA910_010724 [Epithemia clementina (nom. ined.)]
MQQQIAATAIQHYNNVLPARGKPSTSENRKEWTVFAAVVATSGSPSENCWVVSSATGTKCMAVRSDHWESSCLIHDSHAEVLARRGLMRVLWKEVQAALCSKTSCDQTDSMLLERTRDDPSVFALKNGVELHMFISDSPCGDASIYQVDSTGNTDDTRLCTAQFTGAKLVVSNDSTELDIKQQLKHIKDSLVAREIDQQMLGKLRTKSGRSNLESQRRSTSMSCSDKLVRWGVLGLQGSSLNSVIPTAIRLRSCVVGRDCRNAETSEQLRALDRSICHRINDVIKALRNSQDDKVVEFACAIRSPSVHVVDTRMTSFGKAAMEKQRMDNFDTKKRKRGERAKPFPPTGFSINWTVSDGTVEVIVGARGIIQGKKPKSEEDYRKLQSRLCRCQMQQLACQALGTGPNSDETYEEWKGKLALPIMRKVRHDVFAFGPLKGWIVGSGNAESLSNSNGIPLS